MLLRPLMTLLNDLGLWRHAARHARHDTFFAKRFGVGAVTLLCLLLWLTGAQAAPGNGAQFVSQSVPTRLVAGQSYTVSVTMKNTGTSTWSAGANYYLGS